MRPISAVVSAAALAIALSACGSTTGSASGAASGPSPSGHSSATGQAASTPAGSQSSTDFAKALGCTKTTEAKTGELFVKQLFMCTRAQDVIKVYTFTDTTARDNWLSAVKQMGLSYLVIQKGDSWVASKNI